jgi:hypothetical protein
MYRSVRRERSRPDGHRLVVEQPYMEEISVRQQLFFEISMKELSKPRSVTEAAPSVVEAIW